MCSRAVLALLLLSMSGTVLAHKLQVFASADGARIEGSAYFGGGGAAPGAQISILDADGKTLAEPVPDAQGRFSFQAQAPVDHVVVARTGDGHKAEWRVTASELAAGFPGSAVPAARVPALSPGSMPTPAAVEASARPDPTLVASIEQAVSRQVAPLRQELMAAQDQARLRDILGGIGYILGIAGLAAWWRARRGSGSP